MTWQRIALHGIACVPLVLLCQAFVDHIGIAPTLDYASLDFQRAAFLTLWGDLVGVLVLSVFSGFFMAWATGLRHP